MATFLYRVGRFAFRQRWLVLLVWLLLSGGVVLVASQAPAAPTDSTAIPGTEFQWGWLGTVLGVPATGPIQSFMPIFLVGIAFGLAMDYEVFLVSRIREAYIHQPQPGPAVVSGFQRSARVVIAAALIMTSVFAGFITNNNILVKMIGSGLAATVVLDAFVVLMTIVPAVLALLSRSAWWLPRWLNRVLPHLDIEGETLGQRLAAHPAATNAADTAPDPQPTPSAS